MALDFTITGPSGGINLPQQVSLAGGEGMGGFDSVWRVEVFVDSVSKGYTQTSWDNTSWPKTSIMSQGASLRINYTYGDGWNYVYGVSMAFYLKVFTLEWNGGGFDSNEYDTNILNFSVNSPVPTKATTPAPTNAADDVTLDQATVTWVDGGGATSYNVYYGDTSGDLSLVSEGQVGESFTVNGITDGSPYAYITTRYWRIDSINAAGTTTGDEWSFTTIRFAPPSPTYYYTTGNFYYRLFVGGSPPPGGVEGTDYEIVGSANAMLTTRRLVAAANNKFWYEGT